MTTEHSAATTLHSLFARTLGDVHDDLRRVMDQLQPHEALFAEASALFRTSREAMTNQDAAEQLLEKVQAVAKRLTPPSHNLKLDPPALTAAPQQAPAAVTRDEHMNEAADEDRAQEAVTDNSPEEDAEDEAPEEDAPENTPEEAANENGGPEAATGDPLAAEVKSEPAPQHEPSEAATPPLGGATAEFAPPSSPEWPAGTLGEGMLSQLASTLGPGEMLSLILTRPKTGPARLLVTIQPRPIDGEDGGTALALQITDTPKRLDTHLTAKLREYQEGRAVARETVSYLQQVRAAAEAARRAQASSGKKPAPTPGAGKSGTLTLELSPKDAALVLTGPGGKTHPVTPGKPLSLPPGEYVLSADAEGHDHSETRFTVKAGQTTKHGVVLPKTVSGLF